MTDRAEQPQRIQLRRAKGWRLPDGAVVVSRPGPWGNPFIVGVEGTAADCVKLYRNMLAGYVCLSCLGASPGRQRVTMQYVAEHISELRGKSLACWCRLDKPCHADMLLEIANR